MSEDAKTMKKLMALGPFTEHEVNEILNEFDREWRHVGADVIRANAGESVERDSVWDCVMDQLYPGPTPLLKRFFALDPKKRDAFKRPTFPFGRYGM